MDRIMTDEDRTSTGGYDAGGKHMITTSMLSSYSVWTGTSSLMITWVWT